MIRDLYNPKIRGITAKWKNEENTAVISFFLDGEPTEDELEDASVSCTEIIAHFPDGFLEENFIRKDYPEILPESPFWVYRRDESGFDKQKVS